MSVNIEVNGENVYSSDEKQSTYTQYVNGKKVYESNVKPKPGKSASSSTFLNIDSNKITINNRYLKTTTKTDIKTETTDSCSDASSDTSSDTSNKGKVDWDAFSKIFESDFFTNGRKKYIAASAKKAAV